MLAVVKVYSDLSEALVAKSFIEAHGYYGFIPDWHHLSAAWHYTVALQGVRLCTTEADAAGVRMLLDDIEPGGLQEPSFSIGSLFVAAGAYLIAGLPYPIRRIRGSADDVPSL